MSGLFRSGHRTGPYKPAFHSETPIFVRQSKPDERTPEATEVNEQKESDEINHQTETLS